MFPMFCVIQSYEGVAKCRQDDKLGVVMDKIVKAEVRISTLMTSSN